MFFHNFCEKWHIWTTLLTCVKIAFWVVEGDMDIKNEWNKGLRYKNREVSNASTIFLYYLISWLIFSSVIFAMYEWL